MRWLCLDPGEKRTGVALSSPEATFAVPLTVLQHGTEGPAMAQIDALVAEYAIDGILVGVPVSMDGSLSGQSRDSIAFAQRIADHLGTRLVVPGQLIAVSDSLRHTSDFPSTAAENAKGINVVLWDERLSTWQARRAMQQTSSRNRCRESRPRRLDAHAAAVILQSYLDSAAPQRLPPVVSEDES